MKLARILGLVALVAGLSGLGYYSVLPVPREKGVSAVSAAGEMARECHGIGVTPTKRDCLFVVQGVDDIPKAMEIVLRRNLLEHFATVEIRAKGSSIVVEISR